MFPNPIRIFPPTLTPAWEQEIVRRLDASESGNAQSKSFEEVFAALDRRFPS